MNQIIEKVLFSEKVAKFVVDAPRIAQVRVSLGIL